MCGIAGVMAIADVATPAREALRAVRDHTRARGPDGAGEWWSEDGRVGLAHRRLAIIDLSDRGLQPMRDGSLVISFNGEIYNYRALRAGLEAAGERFASDTDTEVLLKLYRRHGTALFRELRGMYAFALWDGERGELLLARDGYGIKPLYYAERNGLVWFASQARALADTGVVDDTPDLRAWNQFLLWGSVPEPRTAYEAIKAVPAGTWVRVRAGRGVTVPVAHFDLARTLATDPRPLGADEAAAALRDSIAHHLVADVPVGVFLSSGIDSGAVLGLAVEAGVTPATVTLGFDEFTGSARDEVPLASQLAAHYGAPHHVRRVSREEFEQDLPAILAAMDQPSIDGINTWFVSKAAHELGWKVAMSGLGGDELFGGYPSFRDVPLWVRWLGWARHLPTMAERVGRTLGRVASHPKAQGLLRYGATWSGAYFMRRGLYMPWELAAAAPSWMPADPDALAESLHGLEALLAPDPGSDHARVATLESGAYMRNQLLRDSDWASMAHSIELRVPLVDTALTRSIGPRAVPSSPSGPKRLLASAPRKPLPDVIIDRPKSGFETPVGEWVRAASDNPRAPWSRRWARRIAAERLPKQTSAWLATRRLRVSQLQRRPVLGNYSVERVFEDVRHQLTHDPTIEILVHVNEHASRGALGRMLDAWNARRRQSEVTHVTGDVHYLAWWLDSRRTVLTVLDCVNLHRLAGLRRAVFKWLWYSVPVRRARRITVISDFTRRELIAETGCDATKITVIYPHLSDEFVPSPARFNVARPRVLQIGTAPNKNIERLLDALAGLSVELVVIGVLSDALRARAAQHGVAVTEKSRLSREQMLDEYRRADIVAFVSTYEGFGLPIIEAQAIGRAVVTGNICSMPEVAGVGAITVDPTDVAAIRAAFARLIDDAAFRDAVVAAGLVNVERFRLPAIARQYRDLYQLVADEARAA